MIRNSIHLFVAVLLAVSGCKLSTDEYAPRTDADCAPDQKACGYKCVSRGDPATGCGNAACTPCARSGTQPICSPDYRCVSADKLEPWGEPRGMASLGEVVYWTELGWNGDVYRWDPVYASGAFVYDQAEWIATGLDPSNSGAVFRLSAYPGYMMYAGGLVGGDLAIYNFDPGVVTGGATPDATLVYSSPGSAATQSWVYGLGIFPGGIYFTTDTDKPLYYVLPPVPSTTAGTVPLPSGADVGGLKASGTFLYFGYPGTLAKVDAGLVVTTVLTNLSSWPSRIAVFDSGGSDAFVWADERDGSVWTSVAGQLLQLEPGEDGVVARMDVAADRSGAVWSNATSGRVTAWNFATGDVFDLPTGGGSPKSVALTTGYVYWTEASPNGVYRVPR